MAGLPSLQEMLSRELARRADANASRYAAERLIMEEGDPDREAKVAAVAARRDRRNDRRVSDARRRAA